MSVEAINAVFEPLPIRRRILVSMDAGQYCVRDVSGEIKEIKADTAYEAIIKSGVGQADKIERIFSLGKNIIEKSKFADESPSKESAPDIQAQENFHRHRSLVISAPDLDALMRAFQQEAKAHEEASLPPVATVAALQEMDASAIPQAPVGEPQGEISPIGVDVHGDGFDEIIPSNIPAKPPAPLKHADHKEDELAAAPVAAFENPPERALSEEEVRKLLDNEKK